MRSIILPTKCWPPNTGPYWPDKKFTAEELERSQVELEERRLRLKQGRVSYIRRGIAGVLI
jgi:hypothetical protein